MFTCFPKLIMNTLRRLKHKKITLPPSSRGMFFLYKSLTACTLNNTSPLPFGLSPIAQTCVISLSNYTSFARGEVGTHIDRGISLLMPLRFVRQAVANGRRSRLYCPSSSALIGSPPCGSCSVCELAHSVYKYASNERFGSRLRLPQLLIINY